jgi:tetratricopeptide (TPR) repeat protein
MGVVYRAEHLGTGQRVALKTVRAPRAELLQNIRREIRALARLRHPGIVRILAEGADAGLPWYAMELLEGRTLRQECRSAALAAGAGAESLAPLSVVLRLARRLCAPLAYLHGEGLVHCDLKPDNILIVGGSREAGVGSSRLPSLSAWPVLVDFGLLSQFGGAGGREALQIETLPAGTARYMAPEQIRGELLDARADLYALGCILYELLAGRPPFEGASAGVVLQKHLYELPRPPSSLASALSPELDELVLSLLAKEPHKRLGYADAVAAGLARIEARSAAGLSLPIEPAPASRAYLYQPRFVGRAEPLSRLLQRLPRPGAAHGRLVLIGGESGMGKTRLARELGREAARRGVRVLSGECLATGARPLEPLRRLLQAAGDRCRERGRAEAERIFGRHGRLLARYEPALAALPGLEACPEPAELPAEAARLRLFRALAATLEALVGEDPLALVLDDLQWAGDLTLGWLEFLLRSGRLGRRPLLLVGTYRTEEVAAGPASPLRALIEAAQVETVELEPLPEAAIASMVCDMLALDTAPPLFVRFLAEHSEGNPFFVAEYLRVAVAEGLLGRDALGRWQFGAAALPAAAEAQPAPHLLPLPGSLRRLLTLRLEGLSPAAGRLVCAAAAVGREAPAELVLAVAELAGPEALEAADEALRRHVLAEPEAGRLGFVHDQLRQVAYEGLTPAQRTALHGSAARAIEERFAQQRDQYAAALGRHWELCGQAAKACACDLEAARRAVLDHAYQEAERLYRAYLRLLEAPSLESVAARIELGASVLQHRGRNREAAEEQLRALEEARALGEPAAQLKALQGVGRIHCKTGRLDEARAHFDRALELARGLGDRKAEGSVLSNLATVDWIEGRWTEAASCWVRALELARESGDRKGEAYALNNLALVHKGRNELAEGLALYHQVLPVLRELGDRHAEAVALANIGLFHQRAARPAEARRFFEQAVDLARELGSRETEGQVLFSLAEVGIDTGRVEEARRLGAEALSILQEIGDRRFEGLVLVRLAGLERHAGDLAAAGSLADRAEALLTEVGDRVNLGHCLCQQGHVQLAAGRPARDRLERAQAYAAALDEQCQAALARSLAVLQRAVEAFEAGRPLLQGECPEDVAEALRSRSID